MLSTYEQTLSKVVKKANENKFSIKCIIKNCKYMYKEKKQRISKILKYFGLQKNILTIKSYF